MSHNPVFVSGTRTTIRFCFETCFCWKRVEGAKHFSEEYLRVFCWRSNELHFSLIVRRVFSSRMIIIHLVREREIR